MNWKIVKWKRVLWVGGALLLLILLLALVKCNPDKPEPTESEEYSQKLKADEQRRNLEIANLHALTQQLIRCSALNDSLVKLQVSTLDKETNDREKDIISQPLTDSELQRKMSDLYNATH